MNCWRMTPSAPRLPLTGWAATYPAERLYNAWFLVLGSQMHDMMAGTAMPAAYDFIWNDELLALNQFTAVTQDASAAVIGGMDTQAQGTCVVVFNPLSFRRQDAAMANLTYSSANAVPADVRVVGPDGKTVPSQVQRDGPTLTVQFLADIPAVGFASYDVQPLIQSQTQPGNLKITDNSLENSRFRVTLNGNGDIASIFDKANNREALSAPARLAFLHEKPLQYPAWNMDWDDRQKPPRAYVEGPAAVRIVESGPCRVALEVTREAQGSTIRPADPVGRRRRRQPRADRLHHRLANIRIQPQGIVPTVRVQPDGDLRQPGRRGATRQQH